MNKNQLTNKTNINEAKKKNEKEKTNSVKLSKFPSETQFKTAAFVYKTLLKIPVNVRTDDEKRKFIWANGIYDLGRGMYPKVPDDTIKPQINTNPTPSDGTALPNIQQLKTATYLYKRVLAIADSDRTDDEKQKLLWAKRILDLGHDQISYVLNSFGKPTKSNAPPMKTISGSTSENISTQNRANLKILTISTGPINNPNNNATKLPKLPPPKTSTISHPKVTPSTVIGGGSTSETNKSIGNRANLKILTNSTAPAKKQQPDNNDTIKVQIPATNTSTSSRNIPVLISNSNEKPIKGAAKNTVVNAPSPAVNAFNSTLNFSNNPQTAFMYPYGAQASTMPGLMMASTNNFQYPYAYNPYAANMQPAASMNNFQNSFMYGYQTANAPHPVPPPAMSSTAPFNQFPISNAYNSAKLNAPTPVFTSSTGASTDKKSFQIPSAYDAPIKNVNSSKAARKNSRSPRETSSKSLKLKDVVQNSSEKPADKINKPAKSFQSRKNIEDFVNPSNPSSSINSLSKSLSAAQNSKPTEKRNEELIAEFILEQFKEFSSSSQSIVGAKRARLMDNIETEASEEELEVAIVDLNNINGTISNWELVNKRLMPSFYVELKRHPELTDRTFETSCHQGRIKLFTFKNPSVIKIFKSAVDKLGQLWPGADLAVLPKSRLPHRPRYQAFIPDKPSDPEKILEILKVSNPELPTYNWEVLNVEAARKAERCICITMNKESFQPMLNKDFNIKYAFGHIKVKMFKQDKILSEKQAITERYNTSKKDFTGRSTQRCRDVNERRTFDNATQRKQENLTFLTETILKQLNDMTDKNLEKKNDHSERALWF